MVIDIFAASYATRWIILLIDTWLGGQHGNTNTNTNTNADTNTNTNTSVDNEFQYNMQILSFFLSIFECYGCEGIPLLLGIELDDDNTNINTKMKRKRDYDYTNSNINDNTDTYKNLFDISPYITEINNNLSSTGLQQLCYIWFHYTRFLDDAPLNLVQGSAYYNASLLVIGLSKLFLYISRSLSSLHFNELLKQTDHYMSFQFNRWISGNYHPSLKLCEADLREVEEKYNS